jgi:CheY-like chemotaxis protein
MPGMNGGDVACELKIRRPGLPIMFTTGYVPVAPLRRVDPTFRTTGRGDKVATDLAPRAGDLRNRIP